MLADELDPRHLTTYIENEKWWADWKADGHRRLLYKKPGNVIESYGRNGILQPVPQGVADGITALPSPLLLDGELVGECFFAFDLLEILDRSTSNLPFATRRDLLERVLADPTTSLRPTRIARTRDEKATLIRDIIEAHGEGIVLKESSASYQWNTKSRYWRKVKFTSTVDCFVTELRPEGKQSAVIGLYTPQGEEIEVGKIKLDPAVLEQLTPRASVLEVRYLGVYNPKEPRLAQPVFMRTRTDKEPAECLTTQLRFLSRTVTG